MKKKKMSLKKLTLNKKVVSKLEEGQVSGGTIVTLACPVTIFCPRTLVCPNTFICPQTALCPETLDCPIETLACSFAGCPSNPCPPF